MWHLDEVLKATKGVTLRVEKETFTGISTDSRTIAEGELFVPITGKTFDAHMYLLDAYERSNGGTICEKEREALCVTLQGTIVLVEDAEQALLDLARYKLQKTQATRIAITGSNGKTTTKEMLVDMAKRAFPVHFNEKNYNNIVGVSKSILSIEGEPEFCIFELGTNSKGEIGRLACAIEPDLSLITNINPSHLEGLGDIEGVLEEKLDLFHLTKEGGTIFVNADDPLIQHYKDEKHTAFTYGIENHAMFRLTVDKSLGWEGAAFTLHFPGDSIHTRTTLLGRHNLYNILAAASIAYSIGAKPDRIQESVEAFSSYAMRFRPVVAKEGYTIVDDSYNANPSSTEWAIKTLLELPAAGKKIAILGDMKELGTKSSHYHRELGRVLSQSPIPVIALIGEEIKETFRELGSGRARLFDDKDRLVDFIKRKAEKGDVILVKGSRASKMEEIVEALK
ncbi:MAG TPA: UDP-N-acetylmuramoyl-tripeptide--D-alanyl-D-alanine ligase [Syntrophorhabdaceae bacterium]|nr:UDP-N-acetylmuramoyl-tripeptide--D-alanyl-D-alanine ligase [Syntrophorhabdaceae bacterium]HQM81308.1 UDP-N-acetylmuramoyl-tripeptide--D-alanyl-D-alanine ligase [Syntrophorhabdaceae bacterium]